MLECFLELDYGLAKVMSLNAGTGGAATLVSHTLYMLTLIMNGLVLSLIWL